MNVTFNQPVLAFAAALAALCVVVVWRFRGSAAALLGIAASMFLLAGAGPAVGGAQLEARHMLVVDVSDSMTPRLEDIKAGIEATQKFSLPPGQTMDRRQLSDALRESGAPVGGSTRYGVLAAQAAQEDFVGECILITDGRGSLDELATALDPTRVILLRAPPPQRPDAAVVALRAPANLPAGGAGVLYADLACDIQARARWRVFVDGREAAGGVEQIAPGAPVTIAHVFVAPASGVLRLSVAVEVEGDREPRNDRASILVRATGRRVVQYVLPGEATEADDALLAALRADATNEVRVVRTLPLPGDLAGTALLVLNDVPLRQAGVDIARLRTVADWVRGGGRLMMAGVGGSFGPGGWRGTPIEDVMPVKFRPDDDAGRRWLLLLDCSDSMNAGAGGLRRMDVLKLGARRLLERLGPRDRACVVGFNREIVGNLEFTAAKDVLFSRLNALDAAPATTNIRGSLTAALRAFVAGDGEARLFLVTDGEEGEAGDAAVWAEIAELAYERGIKIDVVLTEAAARPWTNWLTTGPATVTVSSVGERGFAELVEKLEQTAATADRALIEQGPLSVSGVGASVAVLARTAVREDADTAGPHLVARKDDRDWPLLLTRRLLGRSAALTCETWGGPLWGDDEFRKALTRTLDYLLAGTGRSSLVLKPRPDGGADLLWTGEDPAPSRDFELQDGRRLRLQTPGRWHVPYLSNGEELPIFDAGRLVERLSLPQMAAEELRWTGDDEDFFARAAARGFRVVRSMSGWQPRLVRAPPSRDVDLGWLCAALGAFAVLGAYGLRRN